MKFRTAYTLLAAFPLFGFAQNTPTTSFAPPMKIEPKLSANFGELRKNHFHSGLDYRTESRTGIPVYAAEDGYLVRIFVSPGGFGKALYINHPNGYTTVYAHLDGFIPEIEKYVRFQQYANESFSINDFPNKNLFVFKKGDLIGYSGNSGSSGGPHLHFEIRDQLTEETLNPLGNGYIFIEDNIPPKIKSILIYQQDTIKGVPIPSVFKEVSTNKNIDTLTVPKSFFIGVECADYMPNTTNEYLIKQVTVSVDSASFFNFDMQKFAFNETRFINSIIDFALFTTKKREIVRVYKEPNNTFSVLNNQKNNGIIKFYDSKPHLISVTIIDNNKNEAHYSLWVKGNEVTQPKTQVLSKKIPVYCNKNNTIKKANAQITIPGSSLYQSLLIDYKEDINPNGLGNAVTVGSHLQPLNKPIEVKIRVNLAGTLSDKVFIARGSNKNFTAIGGNFEDGYVTTTSSEFGRFFVDIDTIPPTIKPRFSTIKSYKPTNSTIDFTVVDDKTGIDSYDAYIDGKWVIAEYDPKYNLISVKLDGERIGKEKEHELEFYVADAIGNTSYFKCSFYF